MSTDPLLKKCSSRQPQPVITRNTIYTYEASTWIDVNNCLSIQILFGDNNFDNFRQDLWAQFLETNLIRVLQWDDDGVDTLWHASSILEFVFACDLSWMNWNWNLSCNVIALIHVISDNLCNLIFFSVINCRSCGSENIRMYSFSYIIKNHEAGKCDVSGKGILNLLESLSRGEPMRGLRSVSIRRFSDSIGEPTRLSMAYIPRSRRLHIQTLIPFESEKKNVYFALSHFAESSKAVNFG